MRLWQYFNVGAGVIIPYSNAWFSSGLKKVSEFKRASNSKITTIETTIEKKEDQSLCTLMLCSEPVCSGTFDTVEQFEKHVAEKQSQF